MPEPEFKDSGTSIVVTFRKSEFTEEFLEDLNLNERQKKAVRFLKTGVKITRSEYKDMFNISERTANRELSDLVNLSIFEKIGKGPNIYYVLSKISPNLATKNSKIFICTSFLILLRCRVVLRHFLKTHPNMVKMLILCDDLPYSPLLHDGH